MAVIPGCEAIEQVSDDGYRGRIALRLPGIVGTYRTVVRARRCRSTRLRPARGRGRRVARIDHGAAVVPARRGATAGRASTTTGRATIDGPLARLDGRFVEGLARSLIDQGLGNLDARLQDRRRGPRVRAERAGADAKEAPGVTVTSYLLPASLPEALGLLDDHGPALLVMAGGTVAMPLINDGISLPEAVMGLRRAGLDIERVDGDAAHRRHRDPDAAPRAGRDIPMLREAARNTASWSIRNMGTVGGNLFTPPPGGDVAVALLALDATREPGQRRGERTVPLADFYTGFMTTALRRDELLVEIHVPVPARADRLRQVRPQARQHAGRRDRRRAPRVGRGRGRRRADRARCRRPAPHPRPARPSGCWSGPTSAPDVDRRPRRPRPRRCEPFTDAIATEWYRRRMAGVFVGRALEQLATAAPTRRRPLTMASTIVTFELGDREVEVMVKPMTTLQSVLRDQLGLTAAKEGCRQGGCGELHGARRRRAVLSCLLPVEDVAGRRVTTLEGITPAEGLHPLQQAFVDGYAFQCGYCTPGMVMVAKALLDHDPAPERDDIAEALGGNVCRCTGYQPDHRGDRGRGRGDRATRAERQAR